jgi:hypothetical protein
MAFWQAKLPYFDGLCINLNQALYGHVDKGTARMKVQLVQRYADLALHSQAGMPASKEPWPSDFFFSPSACLVLYSTTQCWELAKRNYGRKHSVGKKFSAHHAPT